jgi:hypothetical protein
VTRSTGEREVRTVEVIHACHKRGETER